MVPNTVVSIVHDREDSLRRYNRLNEYLISALYEEERFTCAHHRSCAASCKGGKVLQTGEAPGVGPCYSLIVDGKPLRIVVVGISVGWESGTVSGKILHSLEQRTNGVHNETFLPSNPHMKGTILALQTLFGQEAYVNKDGHHSKELFGVRIKSGLVNLSMCYAMVNRVACSVGPVPSRRDATKAVLHQNCEQHFRNYLNILEPTVVIVQGIHIQLPAGLAANDTAISPPFVFQFTHPRAGRYRWSTHRNRYYQDTVAPRLLNIARYYGFVS